MPKLGRFSPPAPPARLSQRLIRLMQEFVRQKPV